MIPHLKKCFSYAVAQNKGDSEHLAEAVRSIADHAFDRHDNCGKWCKREESTSHTIKLQDMILYQKLKDTFDKYASNSEKFCVAASSQSNESVNNMIAHKLPKNVCLSKSCAADFRVASVVCIKNDGETSLLTINEKLNLSPGTHTAKHCKKVDKLRLQRAKKAGSKLKKTRRHELRKLREGLRRRHENSEGIQYQPNCGINIDITALNSNHLQSSEMSEKNCDIVYFDLETSDFGDSACILQIADECNQSTFSVYVTPT